MKKIISLLTIVSIIALTGVGVKQNAESATRIYTNAGVLDVNGKTIAVVANGASVETLSITSDNHIVKLAEAIATGNGIEPQAVYTRIENGKPIAYVAAGAAIQKYDISSPSWPSLVSSVDSPLGFTRGITGRSGVPLIIAGGDRGVAEFESTTIMKTRDLWKGTAYGVDANDNGEIVINGFNTAAVLDRNNAPVFTGTVLHSEPVAAVSYISPSGTGFVADDTGVKKLGAQVKFQSQSGFGYTVDSIDDGFVYFANGWGVYKLGSDLQQINFQTINQIGGWARGVKVFRAYGKTRVLVLASDRVYLLDDNLLILDTYQYVPMQNVKTMSIDKPAQLQASSITLGDQALHVSVSKAPVQPGDIIKVFAVGYFPGEQLILEAGPTVYPPDAFGVIVPNSKNLIERSITDGNGNQVFEHIVIPEQSNYPMMINVRVYGVNSHKQGSVALQVQAPTPVAPKEPEITNLATHTENVKESTTTREVTQEQQGNTTIIHETVYTTEKIIPSEVAEMEIKDGKLAIVRGAIAKGSYVRWINKDTTARTISSQTTTNSVSFKSPALKQNENYQFKFETAGTYEYIIDGKTDIVYQIIVQ